MNKRRTRVTLSVVRLENLLQPQLDSSQIYLTKGHLHTVVMIKVSLLRAMRVSHEAKQGMNLSHLGAVLFIERKIVPYFVAAEDDVASESYLTRLKPYTCSFSSCGRDALRA